MARALIVACGCRGQALAGRLSADGWRVRGTTRDSGRHAAIEDAGAQAVLADPASPGSILDQIDDVAVVFWLLGSASGSPEEIAAIHGSRLERLLEKLVDSPVRGFAYEAAGAAQPEHRERGAAVVRAAARRWRIPVEVVDADPADADAWTDAMVAAARRLTT